MPKKVKIVWTKRVFEFFCENGNLTEFQRQVLETRIAGMTIKEQAVYYNCCESTISRTVNDILQIYDVVQSEYPDQLKPRWKSEQQQYLDNN